MTKESYLTQVLEEISELYKEETLEFIMESSLKKKQNGKKMVALAFTMIAVTGFVKRSDFRKLLPVKK